MNHSPPNSPTTISAAEARRFQELVFGLYQCCQHRFAEQSRQFDLPDAELRCLRLFSDNHPLTAKQIARQMGVVKSRISKIIDGLSGRGLIRRDQDPDDSRVWRLSLTPEGRAKLAAINRRVAAANQKIFATLSPAERRSLLIHLEMLQKSMRVAA